MGGSTLRRPSERLTYAQRTIRYLERQEKSVLARIGAGLPARNAVVVDRWSRELSQDTACSWNEAEAFVTAIRDQLSEALDPLPGSRSRVAAARMVYAHVIEMTRSRVEALAPGANDPGSGDHMVYLLFDSFDELLYVGITDRGPVRLVEHYRKKPWFPQVSRVEFERYGTRSASEWREKYLIQRRAPLHNIQHNKGRQIA